MGKLFILGTWFYFLINLINCGIITTLDQLKIVTDHRFLVTNYTINYFDHFKYGVDFDHDIIQTIPEYWVGNFHMNAI